MLLCIGGFSQNSELVDSPLHLTIDSVEFCDRIAETPHGVVIDMATLEETRNQIFLWRSHPQFFYLPLFVTNREYRHLEGVDFLFESVDEFKKKAALVQKAVFLLPWQKEKSLSIEERILLYLFVHRERSLKAEKDLSRPELYVHPLLEAFTGNPSSTYPLLSSLTGRGLLTAGKIIDRIRLCPHCQSSRLSYIDLCTNCDSLDIKKKNIYHCFTCGHVNSEEAFKHGGGLQCPKCGSLLRHIGVDYDRALDDYQCQDCSTIFTEPDVKARCLDCDSLTDPGDLEVRAIQAYTLSDEGVLRVQSGRLDDIMNAFESFNFCTREYLNNTLEWVLRLAQRDATLHFSVVVLRICGVRELVVHGGRMSVVLFLEEFITQLRAMLRTTDLAARYDETALVLLLPLTPQKNLSVVIDRMKVINKKAQFAASGEGLSLSWSTYSSSEEKEKGLSSEDVLAALFDKIREE